ncbi:SPFH/Band 7/PHB domain protein [Phormidium sp. CLA17]|uniref:SPFH domain-containing protein n=1 Tax=Leptolyngbya sp. Cla-17 TaxID=2803751 RepID=UPI001491DAE6|nr:SPFH domain-containing protein [Leptolyngbya sp. Cla-17]MBM0743323.1 SPFH/Band 7/PHB domain protein [Leptolyngbya sp. Cla-17]
MEVIPSLIVIAALAIVGYIIGSIKIINQGYEGIVERLGRYQRTLKPGLNFVVPFLDTVLVDSTREQLLDIEPQSVITKDQVTIIVDAILSWKILNVEKANYTVENVEESLKSLVLTTLRSEIGHMDLREMISSRNKIGQVLLKELDQATATWGVKVIRVEVEKIKLPSTLEKSLENEQAAESERRAAISKADGTVDSIRRIAKALKEDKDQTSEILKYLLAQQYVEANYELGKSNNSKIIFMHPKELSEAVGGLIEMEVAENIQNMGADGEV